jgi:hypothetical protein
MSVDPRAGERSWAVYGLAVTTPHRFVNRVVPTAAPADLWVRPVAAPPIDPGWSRIDPVYRSDLRIAGGAHYLDVIMASDATVFRFSEVVDFFLLDDGIAYQVHDEAYAFMVEIHLLSYVLTFWLERAGVPALHASSVVVDGAAIAFLSRRGGGKTSLAATLLRLGHALSSDDLVAVRPSGAGYLAGPGYPQMRMWPDQARHFLGHDRLERVNRDKPKLRVPVGADGLGTFDGAPRPLTAIYLPRRGESDGVTFETVAPGAALFELVRNSYLTGILEGAGLASRRFRTLADLVQRVPVRIVRYPNGLDLLPEVASAIAADARHVHALQPAQPA